ncbi:hypothetical protein NWF34_22525 [Gordonia sp. GONU]|uniref:hypothetical protein n=1 Tax=Gordonia sp. GONU TaxID=2972949 RepID=UPI0021AC1045|nr:hypothetical protein [Gordonia sp. GONU]MCR8899715.1 hypothetical protein [Gordonia sp. GONU]
MANPRPIPPEIKEANRRRALELVDAAPDTRTAEFDAVMRTVVLPAYREVLARQAAECEQGGATDS